MLGLQLSLHSKKSLCKSMGSLQVGSFLPPSKIMHLSSSGVRNGLEHAWLDNWLELDCINWIELNWIELNWIEWLFVLFNPVLDQWWTCVLSRGTYGVLASQPMAAGIDSSPPWHWIGLSRFRIWMDGSCCTTGACSVVSPNISPWVFVHEDQNKL